MNSFSDLLSFYKAKEIVRYGEVAGRKESVAEHVFSSMMLARVLLKRVSASLDEGRVLLLLLYHDMVELKSGDTFILDTTDKAAKEQKEDEGAQDLAQELPAEIREEFLSCWKEFLAFETNEAKFAHAVDQLDPILQSIEDVEIWNRYGFTAKILREKKLATMRPFPELEKLFEELVAYMVKENIVSEE